MADIRSGAVKFKGNPIDLAGAALKVGDAAPDFKLQDNSLAEISLASSAGKKRIIFTVPSLDTGVCQLETKRFNDEAKNLPDVEVLVVSMDLPFGQKRWCGAESIANVKALSAHRCSAFGENYGTLIKGGVLDRLTARAVFVVDAAGKLTHVEYCAEVTEHPNYDAALTAAKA